MWPRREVNVIGSQESFGRDGEEDGNEDLSFPPFAPFFLGENINSDLSKDICNVDISICNNEFKFKVGIILLYAHIKNTSFYFFK